MLLINEENTQSIRQFKGMKLGTMPPSTAQQARYENTKANFLSLTRVQYVRCGRNTKRNFVSDSRKNENRRLICLPQDMEDH